MPYTLDHLSELNALIKFNLDTMQEGLKFHKHADPVILAAVRRLYEKQLVTQEDGGYLTPMGHETAQHAQDLIGLLALGSAEAPAKK
jgi:uncharacterized protein (TIGR02647 family)